jgi:hypothetical protein
MATNKLASSVPQNWFYHMFANYEQMVDPNNPLHQIAIYSAIHQMAKALSDRGAREGIQSVARKAISKAAK